MGNESLNQPIGEFLKKMKLYSAGFFTPVILFLLYFLSAPAFLVSNSDWKKADVLLIEAWTLPTVKHLLTASEIYKKKRVNSIVILFDEGYNPKKYIGVKDSYIEDSRAYLIQQGIPEDKVEILKIPPGENPGTVNNARVAAKFFITKNVKSILIETDEFHSSRSLKTYRKILAPVGIEVYVAPLKSGVAGKTWFSKEEDMEKIFIQLLKYTYYLLRGYL